MLRRRRRAIAGFVAIVLLAGAGYTAAVAVAPVPEPTVELAVESPQVLAADPGAAQAVVDAQSLPTAIGWAGGEAVWSNDDTPYPLASVSKLITVLVALEAQPLEPGANGPAYTWTQADRERQDYYLSLDGVAYPIPAGTEVTMREMLQFIFLPSANDFAAALAYWVFGDNDTFLAAVDDWKTRNGLESLTLVEPTGMDERNQANAADLVRIARIAVADPTVREFNGMQSAEMPWGVGTIENTNPLLGVVPGVIGVKTGALNVVGYNLVLAQQVDAYGREIVHISVTLARPTKEARAESGAEMLGLMAPLPQQFELLPDGATEVATVTTVTGERIPLVSTDPASAVLLPGETATLSLELGEIDTSAAGGAAGEWIADTPTGETRIGIVTAAAARQPGFWWRFTHPAELFGWG